MVEKIHTIGPVVAVFSSEGPYSKARKEIEMLSQEYGLPVADMPTIIKAVVSQPAIQAQTSIKSVDSTTAEYRGYRKGERYYEVWHGIGSLDEKEGFYPLGGMEAKYLEWEDAGNGKHMLRDVPRVHLEDVRKGDVPEPGTPYIGFVRPDRDNPVFIEKDVERILVSYNSMYYDEFMRDDCTLLFAGNPENRENLARILYSERGDSVYTHYFRSDSFYWMEDHAIGTPISFGGRVLTTRHGFHPRITEGRFLAVSEGLIRNGNAPEIHITPTLDQILEVVENHPKTSRNLNGLVQTVKELYSQ